MSAENDIAGWVVRITTQQLSGGQPMTALYAVAMKTPDAAIEVAKARDGATPGEKAEAVDRLSSKALEALGIVDSEVHRYPPR